MTISSEHGRQSYQGAGTTGPFAVPFKFFDASDLKVVKQSADGTDATLTLNVDYTVTGAGSDLGGTVTTTVAVESGETLSIILDPPLTQLTDYVSNDAFPAESHERALDRVTQQNIRARDMVERALRLPDGDYTVMPELPGAAARAGKFLRFADVTGHPEMAVGIDQSQTLSRSVIGSFLYPRTSAEAAAGVTPSDFRIPSHDAAGVVYAERYGATGDNVADDTAALTNAELVAFTAGCAVELMAGKTYTHSSAWQVRVNVFGYGATVRTTATTYAENAIAVIMVTASGVGIYGVTVNGNLFRTGFSSESVSNLRFVDCAATSCINMGFVSFLGDNIVMQRCKASDIRYRTGNTHADGFYLGRCTRSKWVDCWADNFRRIGFVAEGDGVTKTDYITAERCIASNANNCDDSVGEYNAAFWAENTNNVDWIECIGYNIAGNAGQTSGRVRGMAAFSTGNNAQGTCNVIRCRLYGGNGYLPIGITTGGSGTFADVNIIDCFVQKARVGVSSSCNLNSLTIERLVLEDIVNTIAADGGILIDGSGAALNYLTIDTISAINSTFHADAGLVNFFSAPANCNYTLRNIKGGTHVMRESVSRLLVENCEIACGSTSYSTFLAATIDLVNNTFTSRNNVSTDDIVRGSALVNGSRVRIFGGSITGFGGGWQHSFGGTDISLHVEGVKHELFNWSIGTVGTFVNAFHNNQFYLVPATIGAIRTNFAAPTKQVFIAQNNYFESANAADTPLRRWNTEPTNTIMQGNVYKIATSLHDFGAPTSDVNNVSV